MNGGDDLYPSAGQALKHTGPPPRHQVQHPPGTPAVRGIPVKQDKEKSPKLSDSFLDSEKFWAGLPASPWLEHQMNKRDRYAVTRYWAGRPQGRLRTHDG